MKYAHAVAACLAVASLLAPAPLAAQDYAAQKARIDAVLADPGVKDMHGGVCIVDVLASKPVYSLREAELFIPASNMKLLTTAAALDQLGADFSFQTTFALRGQDMVVIASGDPGLGDERIARKHNATIEAPFLAVVAALKKAGITVVPGDLVVDITVFDTQYFNPNWPANQRDTWYQAEVAGLNFNDNCIDLRCAPGAADGEPAIVEMSPETRYVKIINKAVTDSTRHIVRFQRHGVSNTITASGNIKARGSEFYSVPITDPPAFTMQTFVDLLARNGIGIAGKVRWERVRKPDGSPPEGLTVLYRREQNLGELVWRSNTFSQNFVAECLFKS
ncbi:MAG: D-alanyl-D-alanine carboxypeptidase/D-alanyl-D-alanine-endopeptidase, partial [Phycisphaerae bacterium]|nr:D-alanyl-D-alanine carboxypeptidase/D-alanyl-D-alanine-endopeptidase [Phycisphaerae bacterium]